VVFSKRAADDITRALDQQRLPQVDLPPWDESKVTDPDELVVISHNWEELRHFMWDYVGIVRTSRRLQRAANRLQLLNEEIRDFYSNFTISQDLLELRNLVLVSELIVRCASQRKESRGLHYTLDYPATDPALCQNTTLTPRL
jgi:L-aspartate oxidase